MTAKKNADPQVENPRSLDTIISNICRDMGLSLVFARVGRDSVLVDSIKQYPALVRGFNEEIILTRFINKRKRRCLFYFCDVVDFDTDETNIVSPTCERMTDMAVDFINRLQQVGIESEVVRIVRDYSRFDVGEAGVSMTVMLTYDVCSAIKTEQESIKILINGFPIVTEDSKHTFLIQ